VYYFQPHVLPMRYVPIAFYHKSTYGRIMIVIPGRDDDNQIPQGFSHVPERISGLVRLAFNLWWSWHPGARMLFKTLDRRKWKESVHNPIKMLREIDPEILLSASNNVAYLNSYDAIMIEFEEEIKGNKSWFSDICKEPECLPVAYFSAEYGLHHSLPFYAGGLGFLAGDYIKECSDLGLPLVAIGFMYPEGFFHQKIREDGWQETVDEVLDREAAPITRVHDSQGEQLTVLVPFIEPPIYVAVWKVMVGRVPLYLLDTDIADNDPWNRAISSHLYIGDKEQRLRQEIVLGIGGYKVLNTLGIKHSIAHLNEGHAAFALLERIRKKMEDGKNPDEVFEEVKKTSVFTTHTPVPAGHDVFPFHMMDKYFHAYYPLLGLNRDEFFRLGTHPDEPSNGFNMTVLALTLSQYHNGVSKRHGEVARKMWHSLWPDVTEEAVPIEYVTNGIHVPTWIEPKIDLLLDKYFGPDWLQTHDDPELWKYLDFIDEKELWQTHFWLKMKLINRIRERTRSAFRSEHINPSIVLTAGALLDPTILTLGFARRFATYKRADLIFTDPDRLKRLLNDRWRPLQIIFAGKAHPQDDEGKRILQRIIQFAKDPDIGGRIAFVENYDEQLAQYMVHGVDVWLNNPIPPMEACGTSGMKASLNGVPHLSISDGWWVEGYNGKNGWIFGDTGTKTNTQNDAESLYRILEKEIIPLFYTLDHEGTPLGWVRIMKEAMKSTGPQFSSRRMVKEYVNLFYMRAIGKNNENIPVDFSGDTE